MFLTITPDEETQVMEFWEENNLTSKLILDKEGSIFEKYQVEGIPMGAFIDEDGNLVDISLGWQNDPLEEWEQKAKALLDNQ